MRLLPLLLPLLPLVLGQAAEVECPDSNLTDYLLNLIDTLYTNGLTYYESLLATLSESDEGYALLESWYTEDRMTMFVPTDSAFQKSGLTPPFSTLSAKGLVDMVSLHTVNGKWDYTAVPPNPKKGFAETQLELKSWLNVNDSKVETEAKVPLVLQQGKDGAISIRLATGNATTWGWVINGQNEIWNIDIIPIDTVLPFPPKLSQALTMSTTSRSIDGMKEFQKALDAAGGAQQLEPLTSGGFTIFAPIDDAFTPDVAEYLTGENGVKVLGNHYATNYSLFSRIWVDNGPYDMPVVSGSTVRVQDTEKGATITLNDQVVRILRSDIVLENGVMHIIENVLVDPKSVATASTSRTSGRPSSSPSPSDRAPQNDSAAVATGGAAMKSVDMGYIGLVLFFVLSVV